MKTSIVINFNGDGQEALKMYTNVFGLKKPNIVTYGSMPSDPNFILSNEEKDYIMHTVINIKGLDIMIQDLLRQMQVEYNNNITIGNIVFLEISSKDRPCLKKHFITFSIFSAISIICLSKS